MRETLLREQVRMGLSRGTLPNAPVASVVAGYGNDLHVCAVCDRSIRTHEVEYRAFFEATTAQRHMHGFCFLIWERERRSWDTTTSTPIDGTDAATGNAPGAAFK